MAALTHEQSCDVQLVEGPWYTRAGLVQGASGFEV